MKTQEELDALKQEYQNLTNKIKELNEDELNMITGGALMIKKYIGRNILVLKEQQSMTKSSVGYSAFEESTDDKN